MRLRRYSPWLARSIAVGVIAACVCFAAMIGIRSWRHSKLQTEVAHSLALEVGGSQSAQVVSKLPRDVLESLSKQPDLDLRRALLDLKLFEYDIDTSPARIASALVLLDGVSPATDAEGLPNLRVMNVVNTSTFVWTKQGPIDAHGSDFEELALRFATSANFIERDVAAGLSWALVVIPRPNRPRETQERLERTLRNLSFNLDARQNIAEFAIALRNSRREAGKPAVLFDDLDSFLASLDPK